MVLLGSEAYRHPGGVGGGACDCGGGPLTIPPTIEWNGGAARLIDQRRLPGELASTAAPSTSSARPSARWPSGARRRSAPPARWGRTRRRERRAARRGGAPLEGDAAAVNLAWGVDRALASDDPAAAAVEIATQDVERNRRLGAHGAELIPDDARVLTHCNTGSLACVGYGTALGVIRAAHEAGRRPSVWVDETRPVLQGSRLTAWGSGNSGSRAR